MLSNPTTLILSDFPAASMAFTTPSAIESLAAMTPCTSGWAVSMLLKTEFASSVSQCAVRESTKSSLPSLTDSSKPRFRCWALSAPGLPSMITTFPPGPSALASTLPDILPPARLSGPTKARSTPACFLAASSSATSILMTMIPALIARASGGTRARAYRCQSQSASLPG